MSYNFDGKIANQCPTITNYTSAKARCEKCSKVIDAPLRSFIEIGDKEYLTFSYMDTPHSIYETKGGIAVTYCSDYCKRKHNHRFAR
jgi:hypothetical protein